jgi:CHU_C Type IX secretion signal domain
MKHLKKYLKISGWVAFFLIGFVHHSFATHLRAGEITVKRLGCNGLKFRIYITAYTNTGSQVRYEDGTLNFGDGVSIQRDRIENTDLGNGIGRVMDSTDHNFPGAGRYVITYKERNRNAGILNISNSVNTQFFLETVIVIDPFIGCDNSPRLLVPPIDKGCTGGAWFHNPGAYDPDGDSLSYEFVVPKQDKNIPVGNYRDPNVQEFYDRIGLNYSTANEMKKGPPTFSINPITGTIIWDAPGAPGEYNIAFRVIQWRKVGSTFKQIGYVTRDMQIIIEDCKNKRPDLKVPDPLCVSPDTTINATIFGYDDDLTDKLKLEAFSEVFSLNPSPATYSPKPPIFQTARPATLAFSWNVICSHVKDQPYQVVFKVSDQPPAVGSSSVPSLVKFDTWKITVVGPKPKWNTATPNNAARSVTLNWKNYFCATNAISMEVWRRVDSNKSTPGPCITGMPDSYGYTKIKTLPIGTTTYVDPALEPGAQYCYRLVAIFPAPKGGKSRVSDEICVPPFIADRAIITKVSIEKTDDKLGQIKIEWEPPFDLVPVTGFNYKLFRAEGFTGKNKLVAVFPNTTALRSILDDGLNTRDVIYNYRVVTFDGLVPLKDTSAVASSVRLEIVPKFKELELRWIASVPWSNNTTAHPLHDIYRFVGTATSENQLQLQSPPYATVNVTQKGFVFNDTNLDNNQFYSYKVLARGSYGSTTNPILNDLTNYSQIKIARPNDSIPPCKPSFSVDLKGTDCSIFTCGESKTYTNKLIWNEPDPSCKLDIKNYNIYFAARIGDEFKKLPLTELVTGTEFEHKNLPSYAGCYKISAVDYAGNESKLSESFCFDNCPYYELPNVFTPNGDKCNELFSAYSTRNIGEAGKNDCSEKALTSEQILDLQKRCARFVTKVVFNVYNRWGGNVYTYESSGEKSIYIDWNGKDNGGTDLSSGVYYYEAQVTFDVVDPANRNKTFKGWLQLLR